MDDASDVCGTIDKKAAIMIRVATCGENTNGNWFDHESLGA